MGQCAGCLRLTHTGKVTAQEAPSPTFSTTTTTTTTSAYTSLPNQAGQPWKSTSREQTRGLKTTTDRRTPRRTDTATDTGLPAGPRGHPAPAVPPVGCSSSSSPCPSRLRQMCAAKVMGLFKKCLSKEPKPVVYVPSAVSAQDHYRREMALREQQFNAHIDHAQINLPPSIPISVDGEEGYPASQQRLLRDRMNETESVRAPPNRTVYDSDSPPPYQRSQSVGLLDRHSGKRNNSGSPSGVPRCYSMSSQNRHYSPSNLGSGHHHNGMGMPPGVGGTSYGPTRVPDNYGGSGTRTSLPPPSGHSRSGSSTSSSCGSAPGNLGPPPNYSDIITNLDVFNKPSDSNV